MKTKGNIYFLHRKVDLLSFFMNEMRGEKRQHSSTNCNCKRNSNMIEKTSKGFEQ